MAEMIVTIGQMKHTADQLQNLNERFKACVGQLESAEAALNGMWDGEANNTFHNEFMKDKVQMMNFYTLILLYVARLLQAMVRYQRTEIMNQQISQNRTYH